MYLMAASIMVYSFSTLPPNPLYLPFPNPLFFIPKSTLLLVWIKRRVKILFLIIMNQQQKTESQESQSEYYSSRSRKSKSKSRFTTHKQISHNNLYVPITRLERYKSTKIPKSTVHKLIVTLNFQGNGFRNHQKDIEEFSADFQTKNKIRISIDEINKACFLIWKEKKLDSSANAFSVENKILLSFSLFVLFCILFSCINQQQFVQSAKVIILLLALVSVLIIVINIFVFNKQYVDEDFNEKFIKYIRSKIKQLNTHYFLQRNYEWKTTRECFWISLKCHNDKGSLKQQY